MTTGKSQCRTRPEKQSFSHTLGGAFPRWAKKRSARMSAGSPRQVRRKTHTVSIWASAGAPDQATEILAQQNRESEAS